MVILVFTNLFPNSVDPNYGLFVYHRTQQLCKRHSVHVVAPVPYFPKWLRIPARWQALPRFSRWLQMRRIPAQERCNDLEIYHPRYLMVPAVSAPLHGFLIFLGTIWLVLRLHARHRFDYVDAHFAYPDGFAAVLIAKLLRLPVAVTAHGTDLSVYPHLQSLRPLIQWTLQRANRVICVCSALQSIALRLNVPEERVTVIPNGVDLQLFRAIDKAEARRTVGVPLDSNVILAVSQLIPRKRHHVLIQAVGRLREKFPKLQLFIIGEGDLRESLEREVRALALERHVCFVGAVRNEELFRWYSAADVTCLPSCREGLPCVLLESLACGTPAVATAVGGTPELINSQEVGVLVQQDVLSICSGLEQALEIKWNAAVLARHVLRYAWEQVAIDTENIVSLFAPTESRLADCSGR